MKSKAITARQRQLLVIIYDYIRKTGYPPTFDEMRTALKVASNQSVVDLLKKLEISLIIKRSDSSARGLALLPKAFELLETPRLFPFLGVTTAGVPIEPMEITGEWQSISSELSQLPDEIFILRVRGDSMVGAGIDDQDVVMIQPAKEFVSGDIVLANVSGEKTIKRFISDDKPPFAYLKPENQKYKNIVFTEEVSLSGIVLSVLKKGYWYSLRSSKEKQVNINARQTNIMLSPKNNGSSRADSQRYLMELGISITDSKQPIQFNQNQKELIHRWAPYVQGFSASFVQSIFDKYANLYRNPTVLDPFAGCGTVMVQSKLNGFASFGTDLNPLLCFIAQTKLNSWKVRPQMLLNTVQKLVYDEKASQPAHLKTENHFNAEVLLSLAKIKHAIDNIQLSNQENISIKDLLRVAFSAVLIDSSNLKRSPCLGYDKNKKVDGITPYRLFTQKTNEIAEDLTTLQTKYAKFLNVPGRIILANSEKYTFANNSYDLIITSPPYMNGMDYVMNYKIEMAWLDYIDNSIAAKKIKDEMVVCDNVSKGLIKDFSLSTDKYTNEWIEEIKENIGNNIKKRGRYRRADMPDIVHKYFDDMYRVMKNVTKSIKSNGKFILVVGDSLIADTYVPTDLILARIGVELGLKVDSVEEARTRRSGQIRSYQLRESIVTLTN